MSPSDGPTAQIGVTGLAVMGSNIARNFARHGYTVALHNRSVTKTDALLAQHGSEGNFVRSETIEQFLAALQRPRRVLIMVKAGAATDAVINELAAAMEPGDIIIDGGNALYTDTIRREKAMARTRAALRRSRDLGRRGGRPQRPVDHARRTEGVLRVARAAARGDLRPRRRGALLHPYRPGRGRSLRQDGAQRYRVLRYAADRRGLSAVARRARLHRTADRRCVHRVELGRSGQLPRRDHRRGAASDRRQDRRAAGRPDPRRGRAEGHRPLDGEVGT